MRINEIDDTQNIADLLTRHFDITGKISITNGFVNIDGSCELTSKLSEIPVKFGKVSGGFYCSDNRLTSLEGAPSSVGSNFNCSYNKLPSLEGAPSSVGGRFFCTNNKLTSLRGAPSSVGKGFYCDYNENLELLKLLFIKNLKSITIYDNDIVNNILNKYIGTGPGGALACGAELIRAGFKGNAQR